MSDFSLIVEQLERHRAGIKDAMVRLQVEVEQIDAAIAALKGEVVAAPVATATPHAPKAKPVIVEQGRGELVKPKPKAKRAPLPRQPKYDYAEVARIACAAIEKGESAAAALTVRYDIKRGNADVLISNVRKAGHDIPRTSGGQKLPTTETPITMTAVNGWRPGMAAAMAASVGDHDD